MALSGWSDKLIISIDHSKIDSDLTDFPINILLSDDAGVNGKDLSRIFAKIGSDGNRKKIAVTQDDDATECYVEIERWDTTNKKASLWVKVSSISSDGPTNLYLYFDPTHADNDTYIGDTGDAVAQNVWDDNYKAVYHFNQDPSGGAPQLTDSTSNGNNLTSSGTMTSGDLVDHGARKGWDLDGVDDYASGAMPFALDAYQDFTVEAILDVDKDAGAGRIQWSLAQVPSPNLYNQVLNSGTMYTAGNNTDGAMVVSGPQALYASNQRLMSFSREGTIGTNALYDDTQPSGSFLYEDISVESFGEETLYIGDGPISGPSPSNGTFLDFRISDIARSEAWQHATYRTTADELLSFESFGDVDIALPSISIASTSLEVGLNLGAIIFPSLEVEIGLAGYADSSLPALSAYGEGYVDGIESADLTLPFFTIEINSGFSSDIELKSLELVSSGLHVAPYIGDSILPTFTMDALAGIVAEVELSNVTFTGSGLQGIVGGVNDFLPKLIISAYLDVLQNGIVDVRLKRLLLEASASMGGAWALSVTYPKLTMEINAVFGAIGNASIDLPALEETGLNSYNDVIGNMTGELNI